MSGAMVPRAWPGETAVCLASGPSLTAEDAAFVRGKARVIAINTSYQMAPWADVLYACDDRWWEWHKGVPAFQGAKYALREKAAKFGVTVLKIGKRDGLSLNPSTLCTGGNGGYQAINLAVLYGATRIVLLGYDMQAGPKGKQHWHEPHQDRSQANYARYRQAFQSLVEPLKQAGVSVVNCTRTTALTAFPRMALDQALAGKAVAA